MSKKLSWDKLPETVGRILEILSSEESEHTAIPEIRQRISALEKKFDYLIAALSPDRPVMDMPTVCRILKIRPKTAHELAASGALPSRTEGRKTLFYEDGVVKYFMTQSAWNSTSSVAAKPVTTEPKPDSAIPADGNERIDIKVAGEILDRNAGAIYQLVSTRKIPFHKDGRKVYFITGELREWLASNPPRKRRVR